MLNPLIKYKICPTAKKLDFHTQSYYNVLVIYNGFGLPFQGTDIYGGKTWADFLQ